MISNTYYIEYKKLVEYPSKLMEDVKYYTRLITAIDNLHFEIDNNRILQSDEDFIKYLDKVIDFELWSLEEIKKYIYHKNPQEDGGIALRQLVLYGAIKNQEDAYTQSG